MYMGLTDRGSVFLENQHFHGDSFDNFCRETLEDFFVWENNQRGRLKRAEFQRCRPKILIRGVGNVWSMARRLHAPTQATAF